MIFVSFGAHQYYPNTGVGQGVEFSVGVGHHIELERRQFSGGLSVLVRRVIRFHTHILLI